MNPEKVRCQIIEYTKHEMYLQGADGLTMDDIAKGMKMSKRTLYKLFPSKTCLFRICLSDFTNGISWISPRMKITVLPSNGKRPSGCSSLSMY